MNETDWLTGTDPEAMLAYLQGKTSDRKLRLFACACLRRHWSLLHYPTPRRAVETAERFAEGEVAAGGLEEVRQQIEGWVTTAPEFEQFAYLASAATTAEGAFEAAAATREYMRQQAVRSAAYEAAPWENEAQINARASAEECWAQCELLRELFGNPFRPAAINPSWLDMFGGAVGGMARLIDQEQRFDELPYLADALTDAGCDNEALLRHLRQRGGHYRGCWALDALLDKEGQVHST